MSEAGRRYRASACEPSAALPTLDTTWTIFGTFPGTLNPNPNPTLSWFTVAHLTVKQITTCSVCDLAGLAQIGHWPN